MWRSAPDSLRSLLSKYQQDGLFHQESARKAEKRHHLEEIAKRFVCELPHGSKFVCPPVEALLRQALEEAAPDTFDPLQAAAAFAALEDYAINLLVQPWRGEVQQVKLYSGYYKHTVERQLKNGRVILQLMGYEKKEEEVLQLARVVDPATLSELALDCLIASAECRVLATIMDGLKECGIPMTWKELYRFRRECSCNPEDSVRTLIQRQKHRTTKQMAVPELSAMEPLFQWHHLPAEEVDRTGWLVQMPTNGTWPTSSHWDTYLEPPLSHSADSQRPLANSRSPAGMRGTKHSDDLLMGTVDGSCSRDTFRPLVGSYGMPLWPDHPNAGGHDTGVPRLPDHLRYDGGRSGEHYSQSVRRGPSPKARQSEISHAASKEPVDLISQGMHALSLGSGLIGQERDAGSFIVQEPVVLKAVPSCDPGPKDTLDATTVVEAAAQYLHAQAAAAIGEASHDTQVWSCGACTFLNAPERDVCEMCSKSRHTGPEMTPLLSGGKQCPVCTLVNDRQAKSCSVCSTSLKDSPTYI